MVAAIFVPMSLVFATTGIRLVPALFHEVYGTITGIVLAAMFGPVPLVTGGHMQIERLDHNVRRLTDNDHRLCIEYRWRRGVAELHLTINARADFTADTEVYDGGSRMGRQTGENKACKECG
jgi:hypothetical protein